MEFILLVIGLAGLWLGSELTIRGAITIAKRFGISEFIVGVAILSVGSDLPELTIAVTAAINILQTGQAASTVIIGSAVGSAMGQIGFVLGVVGLLGYLRLPRQEVYRHGSMLIGSVLVLAFFGFDGTLARTEGISLTVIYFIYFTFLLTEQSQPGQLEDEDSPLPKYRALIFLLVGLVTVIGSAEITVYAVTSAAEKFQIEQLFISTVVIGLGTSLPELSISVAAILRKRTGLSVGNLIGSNIFDTLVPIGVAATIAPLQFDMRILRVDLPFLLLLSVLVLVFLRRKRGLQKFEAAILLAIYGSYALVRMFNV